MNIIPTEVCINDTVTTSPAASPKKKTSPPGIPRDLHLEIRGVLAIRGLNYCKHTITTYDWYTRGKDNVRLVPW